MRHIDEFDGLRCFAVTFVLLSHSVGNIIPGGGFGVDIFFALSGFLITSVLLNDFDSDGRISFGRFYIRRFLRLTPAFALMLLGYTFVMSVFSKPGDRALPDVIAAATYTMNWIRAFNISGGGPLGHTWSLAVEEQFYIFWPIALAKLCSFFDRKTAALLTLATAGAFLAWRCWLAANGADINRVYNGFDMRADELLLGCALALWLRSNPAMNHRFNALAKLWPIPVAIIALSIATDPWIGYPLRYSLSAAATAWIMFSILSNECRPLSFVLTLKPFTLIGVISYGIYLWHYPIFHFLSSKVHGWGLFIVGSFISIVVSYAS
jgi:peptidoglycan/LPS O-acetylase OafA/YrhL